MTLSLSPTTCMTSTKARKTYAWACFISRQNMLRVHVLQVWDPDSSHHGMQAGHAVRPSLHHKIMGMGSTNERRRYIVTSPLISWAHTQNEPWESVEFQITSRMTKKSSFTVKDVLFYFLRSSLCPQRPIPRKPTTDRSFCHCRKGRSFLS